MSDVFTSGAEILLPLLAGGAGAAANEVAKKSSGQLYEGAALIFRRLRRRGEVLNDSTELPELTAMLQEAVGDGDLQTEELAELVNSSEQAARINLHTNTMTTDRSVIGSNISGGVRFGD